LAKDQEVDVTYVLFEKSSTSFLKHIFFVSDEENLIFTDSMGHNINYTGEVKDGAPHGQGRGFYFDHSPPFTYEGEWKEGLPQAFWASSNNMNTENRTNKPTTKQEPMKDNNGEVSYVTDMSYTDKSGTKYKYTGDIRNGIPNGNGTGLTNLPDGYTNTYEGQWKDGLHHGFGEKYWSHKDFTFYIGYWRNGLKHGTGIFTFANGDTYTGTYVDGKGHTNGKSFNF
jgi:hypothetical protein